MSGALSGTGKLKKSFEVSIEEANFRMEAGKNPDKIEQEWVVYLRMGTPSR